MASDNLVFPESFSLQYPNLTASHAEYAKIGSRANANIIYYFTKFKSAVRWPDDTETSDIRDKRAKREAF
jgi:hypothetical protein